MTTYSPSKLQAIIRRQGRRIYWLAEAAELHQVTLYRFLRGERGLSDEAANRIAEALDVSPEAFKGDTDKVIA